MVDQGRIVLKYIKSDNMDADGFSKPYDPTRWKLLHLNSNLD
jgi:hypothetical protein